MVADLPIVATRDSCRYLLRSTSVFSHAIRAVETYLNPSVLCLEAAFMWWCKYLSAGVGTAVWRATSGRTTTTPAHPGLDRFEAAEHAVDVHGIGTADAATRHPSRFNK